MMSDSRLFDKHWFWVFCCFFFSTHAALAVTACTEAKHANHTSPFTWKQGFQGYHLKCDYVVMAYWCDGLKNGPPPFCVALPA